MQQKYIDPDDAPPLTGDELQRPDTKWRIGRKEVSAEEGKAAFRKAWNRKTRTNIHLDNDVIAHYKALAGARGYQTLINAALRRDMEGTTLKNELKNELRDELLQELRARIATELEASERARVAAINSVSVGVALGTAVPGYLSNYLLLVDSPVVKGGNRTTHGASGPNPCWSPGLKQTADTRGNSDPIILVSATHAQGTA